MREQRAWQLGAALCGAGLAGVATLYSQDQVPGTIPGWSIAVAGAVTIIGACLFFVGGRPRARSARKEPRPNRLLSGRTIHRLGTRVAVLVAVAGAATFITVQVIDPEDPPDVPRGAQGPTPTTTEPDARNEVSPPTTTVAPPPAPSSKVPPSDGTEAVLFAPASSPSSLDYSDQATTPVCSDGTVPGPTSCIPASEAEYVPSSL